MHYPIDNTFELRNDATVPRKWVFGGDGDRKMNQDTFRMCLHLCSRVSPLPCPRELQLSLIRGLQSNEAVTACAARGHDLLPACAEFHHAETLQGP